MNLSACNVDFGTQAITTESLRDIYGVEVAVVRVMLPGGEERGVHTHAP